MVDTFRELNINPKFQNLLDLPSESERTELEKSLLKDGGPRDAIIIRKGTNEIVDGHNRYGICKAHNLPFKTEEREFADDDAVEEWMIQNQLSRRNLSPVRAAYFLGLLYNKSKQDPTKAREATEDGKTTAEKLGEQYNVSERTVRRAGDEAAGIEVVAETLGLKTVQDKLQQIKGRNALAFTSGELSVIGKVADKKIAKTAAQTLVKEKVEAAKTKARNKLHKPEPKAAAKVSKEVYDVVFAKPKFDKAGFSVRTETKPVMAENCMVYIAAQDEDLVTAIELMKAWGVKYEASFVFKVDGHEGAWSDIQHMFMLAGAKGTVTGPKKASKSIPTVPADISVDNAMIKLVNAYHPGAKIFISAATKL